MCFDIIIRIIIIIAPLTIVKEDQWGDLECLYKACQAAITDGCLFTDTGVDERCENERQGENDYEMKTVNRRHFSQYHGCRCLLNTYVSVLL